MSDFKVLSYTPQIHESLKQFMMIQYPNRSKEYISWWLTNVKNGGKYLWDKTYIILDGSEVVGCMTANKGEIYEGELRPIFYEANTIINPNYRSRGLGKQLYKILGTHPDRCTIGMTDIAFQIQKNLFKNNTILNPILVYSTINMYAFKDILRKLFCSRREFIGNSYPNTIKLGKITFIAINKFDEIDSIPPNGLWMHENREIPRTSTFLKHRFDDIWMADSYKRYMIHDDNKLIGYVVYRVGKLYGINMMIIVDYRCCDLMYESLVFKVANKLAKANKLGFSLCLTSRKYGILSFFPLRIKLFKKISGISGPLIKDGNVLFTSGDSDIDFVYY